MVFLTGRMNVDVLLPMAGGDHDSFLECAC